MPLTGQTGTSPNVTYYPIPLVFTPSQLPGFTDYASTYSEFRLLKAKCKVHLALPGDSSEQPVLTNQPYTYLRVSSRPFIEDRAQAVATSQGAASNPASIIDIVGKAGNTVSVLRQSRWQRQYYPSDIKNSVSFSFYPYTLEWCGRPIGNYGATANLNTRYLKYASGRKWMPMSFLGTNPTSALGEDVSFLGPFFVRLLSTQADDQSLAEFVPVVTLSLYCQFRGQK